MTLTDKQTQWLIRHFKHTKNDDITAKLHISASYLHRLARALGLKKTRQFMRKTQANAVVHAQAAIANEDEEAKERRRQQARDNGAKTRFQPREYPLRDKSPEELADIHRRKAATWRETRRNDEIRLNWGYDQQTRFHFARVKDRDLNRQLCGLRYYLRKCGYEIPQRSGMVAYITASTTRTAKCESRAKQLGMIFRTR